LYVTAEMEVVRIAVWNRMWGRCWGRMTTTTMPTMRMRTRTRKMSQKSWKVGYVESLGVAEHRRDHEDVKSSAWNRGWRRMMGTLEWTEALAEARWEEWDDGMICW
jgi:hypothetical protein